MGKFQNWLLVAVGIVLATADQTTDLFPLLLKQFNAPEWVGTVLRLAVAVCLAVKLKLQPPSLKEAKQEEAKNINVNV